MVLDVAAPRATHVVVRAGEFGHRFPDIVLREQFAAGTELGVAGRPDPIGDHVDMVAGLPLLLGGPALLRAVDFVHQEWPTSNLLESVHIMIGG